jgi:hypothetical protein
MPKKIADTTGFEITLSKTLVEQLDKLALTGMYGAERRDVIEHILSEQIRRLFASGEFSSLRERITEYPAKASNGEKKEAKPG